MQLVRCKDQNSETLEETYIRDTQQENYACREGGKAMLGLIKRLKELPDARCVWGLTSHLRLCLLAEDSYKSPWLVIVSALNNRNYYVEYLMPKHIAPWPKAYVKGEPRSEDEALQMIITAMEKSEGWNNKT